MTYDQQSLEEIQHPETIWSAHAADRTKWKTETSFRNYIMGLYYDNILRDSTFGNHPWPERMCAMTD
eukprot:scaffold165830_cov55-Prasinocladus_malaysianus.AAC.1